MIPALSGLGSSGIYRTSALDKNTHLYLPCLRSALHNALRTCLSKALYHPRLPSPGNHYGRVKVLEASHVNLNACFGISQSIFTLSPPLPDAD